MSAKSLNPTDFTSLNLFEKSFPIKIDLVYANPSHEDNHFKNLYHCEATQLWAHKDIAPIVLLASLIVNKQFGWTLKINDCLRPIEAQQQMSRYGYDPALVSTPGSGAHPRGMAIDVEPIDRHGNIVNMGTPFDYFSPCIDDNPAARNYTRFKTDSIEDLFLIRGNRDNLETAMRMAADMLNQRLLPLPQEWWDFRFEDGNDESTRRSDVTYWSDYSPISENDFPAYMHLVGKPEPIPLEVNEALFKHATEIEYMVKTMAERIGVYKMPELSYLYTSPSTVAEHNFTLTNYLKNHASEEKILTLQ